MPLAMVAPVAAVVPSVLVGVPPMLAVEVGGAAVMPTPAVTAAMVGPVKL
ncbi:MAG: hypothetical protein IPO38_11305 [Rhodocyclaceae bacterium]|nr:hypothetical protein [Rhodocyclaceae bacterium]